MPVTKFPRLTIWLFYKKRPFRTFGRFRGLFKETNNKNWGFCVEKERERKNTLSSSNMDKKSMTKKRE